MRAGSGSCWLLLMLGLNFAQVAGAQTVRAQLVASGFARPVVLASPPGGTRRLFVVEQQTGAIRILDPRTGGVGTVPLPRYSPAPTP